MVALDGQEERGSNSHSLSMKLKSLLQETCLFDLLFELLKEPWNSSDNVLSRASQQLPTLKR